MRRIVVAGGPGSGKSWLARRLADRLDVAHIELDALWWGPEWTPVGPEELRRRVRAAICEDDGWVVDGNYFDEVARDVLWPAADTLVWLDLPRARCIARTLRRGAGRVVRRTELWGSNTQPLSTLGPTSVARLVARWPRYSATIASLLASGDHRGLTVVRIRSRRQLDEWLADLTGRHLPDAPGSPENIAP